MSLNDYSEKRRFDETPEPPPADAQATGPLRFVVQKHVASRLHYDLRLEFGGALKSWAVPKGPSLVPQEKHLAVMVEDHPLDYRTFEGVIPNGNYGAGTVMVWDEGSFHPAANGDREANEKTLQAQLEKGHITVILEGSKLRGEFALVRLRRGGEHDWLLIKANDDSASDQDILKSDRSALTGRTMDEIAAAGASQPQHVDLSDAPEGAMPRKVTPMLATLVEEAFDKQGWLFEIKWDGYRAVAEIEAGSVRLYSRNLQPFNDKFAPVVGALEDFGHDAVLDGEVVVLDEAGTPQFQLLQDYAASPQGALVYYVFDILYLDGHDLRGLPLVRRKEILKAVIPRSPQVRFSDHVEDQGAAFYKLAAEKGLEGVLAKDGQSPYREGVRGRDWLKIKARLRQEFVVGGFTEPQGGRKRFGALLMGVYEGNGLTFAGHVGGGFDDAGLERLYAMLEPSIREVSPFKEQFPTNTPAHWVEPKLVCEVEFAGWTKERYLRQPVFIGLREDKDPRAVRVEAPQEPPTVVPSAKDVTAAVGDRKLRLTNLNKVYWPDEGYTKGDLIDYYRRIAPYILPYLKDRPLSLNRHPHGIVGESFFQKNADQHTPDWVQIAPIHSGTEERDINYIVCQDEATLVYLANLGCIEINPWFSRTQSLDKPDYLAIDLDPEDISFDKVIEAALAVREILDRAGASSYPKTSGATGLHIYVPLAGTYTYDTARQFARVVAHLVNAKLPKSTSVERVPAKRQKMVYLDYLQNRHGQTLAAPYCVRPRPGATVSTPLKWEEVRPGLSPADFTFKTIMERLEKMGDIFATTLGDGIDMAECLDKLQ